MVQLAAIPWAEGATVFVFGFGGVFIALLLLFAGMKLTSGLARRLEAGRESEKNKKP
jgi:Na+-transporting methylmalonyl-CoA/oxaloacetate decarboxylase gamma subunit